jgi:hypothetical protein
MASIITAGNATNGLSMSSDGTGILEVKTGPGTGTTAMTVDASQNVTVAGTLTATGGIVGGGGNYILRNYASPATWTKSPTLKAVKVTVVGSGGTGAGTPATTGGGGGGGGAAIYYAPAPSIPGPQAVTAGPGTNSFGSIASATAGANGGAYPTTGVGGVGGAGSGGTVNFSGAAGTNSTNSSSAGNGGPSILGGGGRGYNVGGSPALSPALSGGNYGGGGGGGGNAPGAAGANGIVIVEEFY